MLKTFILVTLLGGAAYIGLKCLNCKSPEIPKLNLDEWWGPKQLIGRLDTNVRSFSVKFDDEMIKDLKSRLVNHRPLTPALENIDHEYGTNTKYLQELITYWSKDYPFKERERFLNQYPQYKVGIQGLNIHFIRVKPEVKSSTKVVPLLLLHGWPGSVREFYEAIPLLTKTRPGSDFVFEVIVPSLPGYGFSDPATKPGLGPAQIAVVMRNLMNKLGHSRYVVQGGDWGSAIGSSLSTLFPEEVIGFHTNMAFVMNNCASLKVLLGSLVPSFVVDSALADRMYPLSKFFAYVLQEFGYFHLQATKPDTVGVALNDSPAGLASYIVEKFLTWTKPGSKVLPATPTKEGVIDNLMLYWTSGSITTAMRLYSEANSNKYRELKLDDVPTKVPTWALQAKYELFYQPPSILKTKYQNLLGTTILDFGGHFFAFERPEAFSEDVYKATKEFLKWREESAKKSEL